MVAKSLWDKDGTIGDNHLNDTVEFQTYSEVSGTRFGIILAYNPGNETIRIGSTQRPGFAGLRVCFPGLVHGPLAGMSGT